MIALSLELAGIEDIFIMPEEPAIRFFHEARQQGKGRLLVFFARSNLKQKASQDSPCPTGIAQRLLAIAKACRIPSYEDRPHPRILVAAASDDDAADTMTKRLSWTQPDAIVKKSSAHDTQEWHGLGMYDAVFACCSKNPFDARAAVPASSTRWPDVSSFVPFGADNAPMLFGPGMEACWTGPSPDFFHNRRVSAFLNVKDEA